MPIDVSTIYIAPNPTPGELEEDPELATLEALDHVLHLAVSAIVAVKPEVMENHPSPAFRTTAPDICTAKNILRLAHALSDMIALYGQIVETKRYKRLTCSQGDDEIPF